MFHDNQVAKQTPWVTLPNMGEKSQKGATAVPTTAHVGFEEFQDS